MLSQTICRLLEEKKATDVLCLPVKNDVADEVVIASGTSSRHVQSLAHLLAKEMKSFVCGIEGLEGGEWVLLDCGDVIVHLFKPETRAFYDLEDIYAKQKLIFHSEK